MIILTYCTRIFTRFNQTALKPIKNLICFQLQIKCTSRATKQKTVATCQLLLFNLLFLITENCTFFQN